MTEVHPPSSPVYPDYIRRIVQEHVVPKLRELYEKHKDEIESAVSDLNERDKIDKIVLLAYRLTEDVQNILMKAFPGAKPLYNLDEPYVNELESVNPHSILIAGVTIGPGAGEPRTYYDIIVGLDYDPDARERLVPYIVVRFM